MISRVQSGRLEEQRCFLQPSRSTPSSPTHNGSALKNVPIGQKKCIVPLRPDICIWSVRPVRCQ